MRRTALMFALAGLVGALVAVPIAVYASHQFTDVPNTNPFHADIDWLADAGVTKGCGGSSYCPKDNVTREQMAAFMRRLSGNDPGVAPSVNANQLDGFNVQQLAPRAVWAATSDVPDLRAGQTTYTLTATQVLVAPAPGILLVSGGVDAHNNSSQNVYACWLNTDVVAVPGSKRISVVDGATNQSENCTTSGAMTVSAGSYTIELVVSFLEADTNLIGASVWAMWVPFDGNGNTP